MTGVLTPAGRSSSASPVPAQRPLALSAVVAGVLAAGGVLAVCMALGLLGWFGSDAGSHGDTKDALRVGADAWLLAHGAWLELPVATVSVVPLGVTVLCAFVTFRVGRWCAQGTQAPDRSLMLGAVALAAAYGAVALVTAVLASLAGAGTHPARAVLGGVLLALLSGGPGIVAGAGRAGAWRARLPEPAVAMVVGVSATVLLMLAAGALLAAAGLAADFGAGAAVLGRLHTHVWGGLLYSLVVLAVAPNAALWGAAYLTGPGFAVGTGTVVSPAVVTLGPVPEFPLLAALPDGGPGPAWTMGLVGVPVLCGAVAVVLALRRYATPATRTRYDRAGPLGLLTGLVGGALLGVLSGLAGGAVGPGRMAEVGAFWGQVALEGGLAAGAGGLLSGLLLVWSTRRRRGTGPG